jgi:hypothetical protein
VLITLLVLNTNNAQSIDERYHVFRKTLPSSTTNSNIDPETYDYCLTEKVDGQGYVAVSATLDNPSGSANQWCIKLVEFDSSGGLKDSIESRYIYPMPSQAHHIRPLKIITLNGGTGYVLTGYHLHISESCPMPFAVKLDANYNVIDARVFNTCGFFTDVDQMPNDSFIFSGSWSDNTNMVGIRQAAIMRTDANFNPVYARTIEKAPIGGALADFDIIHDLSVIDDDHAYITGCVTDLCSTTPNTTSRGLLLFGEIDLNTGIFNWTNNCIDNIHNIGSRVIYNNNYVAVAVNADAGSSSGIVFFDRTGTFITRFLIENTSTVINYGSLNTHVPFIQNIYFISNDEVHFSGKYTKTQLNGDTSTHYEIPFSGEIDITGNASNGALYVTDQHYLNPYDFMYYDQHNTRCIGSTTVYLPIYAASNTIPKNGESETFVTVTHDNIDTIKYNKTWFFTNDNQVCGYTPLEFIIDEQSSTIPFPVTNTAKTIPVALQLALSSFQLEKEDVDCDDSPN